jgi:hypothetical protein
MSVRYYQSASSSQQANAVLQQIQAITAAADGLAQATGSYSAAGVNSATLAPLLPSGSTGLTTPWGTAIGVEASGPSSYKVTIPGMPSGVCPLVVSKLKTNNHFTGVTNCSGVTTVAYTYLANP